MREETVNSRGQEGREFPNTIEAHPTQQEERYD